MAANNGDDDLSLEGEEQTGSTHDSSVAMSEGDDLESINERIKQIEQEAQKIREMQTEVEKQFNAPATTSGSPVFPPTLSLEEKMAIDARSAFIGNVDYSATPDQLEEHFRGCGSIERVTILTDKYSGHPKGFAYIQFADGEGMQNALALDESLFLGRQIKVSMKRTNKPGISTTNRPPRGRGIRGARVIVKYVYPGFRGGRGRPMRRRGFSPY